MRVWLRCSCKCKCVCVCVFPSKCGRDNRLLRCEACVGREACEQTLFKTPGPNQNARDASVAKANADHHPNPQCESRNPNWGNGPVTVIAHSTTPAFEAAQAGRRSEDTKARRSPLVPFWWELERKKWCCPSFCMKCAHGTSAKKVKNKMLASVHCDNENCSWDSSWFLHNRLFIRRQLRSV